MSPKKWYIKKLVSSFPQDWKLKKGDSITTGKILRITLRRNPVKKLNSESGNFWNFWCIEMTCSFIYTKIKIKKNFNPLKKLGMPLIKSVLDVFRSFSKNWHATDPYRSKCVTSTHTSRQSTQIFITIKYFCIYTNVDKLRPNFISLLSLKFLSIKNTITFF